MQEIIFPVLLFVGGIVLLFVMMLVHKKSIMPRLKEQVRKDASDAKLREAAKKVEAKSVVQNDPFEGIDVTPRPSFFSRFKK